MPSRCKLGLMQRGWVGQAELNRARGRIQHVVVDFDLLFVQTSLGVLQAFDAESGKTRWAWQVGRPDYPSSLPGANQSLVAVINGSRLYVLNRADGEVVWEQQTRGAPGTGPALSKERVFVPMIGGKVESYELESKQNNRRPWMYASRSSGVSGAGMRIW